MPLRNCPLCASARYQSIPNDDAVEKVGANVICLQCGLIYHNPVMSPQAMARYYAQEFSGHYHESKEMQQGLAQRRLSFLQKALEEAPGPDVALASLSPVLEVGCAYGDFLAALMQQGVEAEGVEASQQLAQIARRDRGVQVNNLSYEQSPQRPEYFGMVASFHVLEHFYDPLAALQRMWRELKAGGVLYVVVPTLAESQLAQVFKAIHPTTFVAETLALMLNRAGFEVLSLCEQGYDLVAVARKGQKSEGTAADAGKIFSRATAYLKRRRDIIDGMVKKLQALEGVPGVAIYGAGHNTLDLNEVFPLSRLDVVGVYDADPQKQGQPLLGQTIAAPAALQHFGGTAVIISSYQFQEEIAAQLHYLEQRGVELIQLYDKS